MTKQQQPKEYQQNDKSSHIGYLKEMMETMGRKLFVKEIDRKMGNIKDVLWIPNADQEKRFTSHNLLCEKLAILFMVKNMGKIMITDFENIMKTQKEQQLTTIEKLEKHNKKLSDELRKRVKI